MSASRSVHLRAATRASALAQWQTDAVSEALIEAAACGRPADGLYRHVRILVKSGFLVDVGTRKGKRKTVAGKKSVKEMK